MLLSIIMAIMQGGEIMRRIIIYLAITLLFSSFSFAQAPDTLWTKIYNPGEWNLVSQVLQANDDGYIIVGSSRQNSDPTVIWVLKTDQLGNMQWERFYGGPVFETGQSVLITADGGYLISATVQDTLNPGDDISFIKIDGIGNFEWEVQFAKNEDDWIRESQHTADGGFIHTGATGIFRDSLDFLLLKTDSECNTEWAVTFGGELYEGSFSVQQTTDGGYITAGGTESYGSGWVDVYIVKTDSRGNLEWDAVFGYADYDKALAVRQTQDGGYLILGYTYSFSSNCDLWLIKIDCLGNMEWDQVLDNGGADYGYSFLEAPDGGFVITGGTGGDLWLFKTDSIGNIEWETSIGYQGNSNEGGKSLQQTSDGGYIVAGIIDPGGGMLDLWLVKFGSVLGIPEGSQSVSSMLIRTISPDPFSSSLSITYSIPQMGQIELSVFDYSGRLIENLENCEASSGEYTFVWNPEPSLPNGCYIVVLDACGEQSVRRCVKL